MASDPTGPSTKERSAETMPTSRGTKTLRRRASMPATIAVTHSSTDVVPPIGHGSLSEHAVERRRLGLLVAHQVGVDPRRMHGADAHALVGDLEPQRVAERLDAGLRRRVGGQTRQHGERRRRGDDAHVAAARDDVRQGGGDGTDDADEVDVDRAHDDLDRAHRDRVVVRHAGVRHDDVDAAELATAP